MKGKKASKELNNSTISKTSTSSSDVYIPIPPDESNFIIEVQLMKEETPTESEEGFKFKTDVERPVTIATPDQINSRSFDQEESMTPSSCSTPMEEKIAKDSSNIVHKLVEQVLKAQTPVKSILKTSEEINIKVLPKPKSNHPNWPCGRGRGWRPAHPLRPGQVRQPAPVQDLLSEQWVQECRDRSGQVSLLVTDPVKLFQGLAWLLEAPDYPILGLPILLSGALCPPPSTASALLQ